MKRVPLALLAFLSLGVVLGVGQGTQPTPPQGGVQVAKANRSQPANVPTLSDIYCAGYVTNEKVPENHFVVGGWMTPDQTKYASTKDSVYIYGAGLKEGDRLQIIRHVKDPNHYEGYKGQKTTVKAYGEAYFERGYARVINVQRNVGIAQMELACGETIPGDIAVPFVERERPVLRNIALDRFAVPNGKPTGRIILANEFDIFVGSKYKVYLNIGADKGLKVGDYLRATRTYDYTYHDFEAGLSAKASFSEDTMHKNSPKVSKEIIKQLPRRTLGDMVVLQVHPRTATAMIVTALEDIHVGDGVELMDETEAPPAAAATEAPAEAAPAAAPNAPVISCSASPNSVRVGESTTISCNASSPDNRPITIRFNSNGGRLTPGNNRATLDTTDANAGPIAVRATATDDRDMSSFAVATVNVEPAPAPLPTAQRLSQLEFKPNSAYVDNRAKAVLDDVALKAQQEPRSVVLLSGSADEKETPRLANQRAQNAMNYLTKSKGIDSTRIQVKTGPPHGRIVDVWSIPPGANMPQ
ncbi:MAG TPA: OmpA family protein [Candidatus Angelobacter sp.]|jgi:outer membrane protein OmpA-like peptidoglycan-associated protein|nr:OmpA family protein [Candidatus Angelobacter sp.]